MFLKSLSIVGFKSFADRTRISFEPGVTVVVGPNGSGKSNIVDAIAWVMGTQATSTLRTQRMEDVIFAGTALRPALGRAEVSLTFDNADGDLAVDLPDVTIARRLYRDGTSEYEINGASCRLLDVQEMLADSGVGRHQHTLVGQGRVEAVLNAGPDQHRSVIEEAAGVVKHRHRRDRALRRLEATESDVQRLHDLLGEQKRRMRPLRRQANAAERHTALKEAWKALRLWVGGEQLRSVRARRAEIAAADTAATTRITAAEEEAAALDAEIAELHLASGEVGTALERDTAAAARLETGVERLRRVAMVARERRTAMSGRLAGAGERRRDLEEERDEIATAIITSAAEERAARAAAERAEITLRSLEDEERLLAEQDSLPAEGVVATLRGDLASLEAGERRDRAEGEAAEARRRSVVDRLAADAAEAERLGAEIRDADARLRPSQTALDAATAEHSAAATGLEKAATADTAARVAFAEASARVAAIEGALEGLGDPEARERAAALSGVLGPLAARLDVPGDLTAAVDTALGEWADAFAAEGRDALAAATGAVKAAGDGGVAFVVASGSGDAPAAAVAEASGVEALVHRLGPACDGALASSLLGDVLLVEGWATAWELVVANPGLRAVTPEGDLITATGVRAADPEGAGPAALEVAGVAAERAQTGASRAASLLATARREEERSARSLDQAREAVEAAEARLGGASEALRLVERARAEAEAELERLDERRAALAEHASARAERLAELRSRLAAFEGEEAASQQAWEALARRREHVAERREGARKSSQEAAAALAAATERRRLLHDRKGEVAGLLTDLDAKPVDPAEIERLGTVEETARRAMRAAQGHVVVLRERQRELRATAGETGTRLDTAEGRRAELRSALDSDREAAGLRAVEEAELRVREEAAGEALRRDADTAEEIALAAPRPEIPEGADPEEHLATLEASLRRLGPINPLAAAEYRELSERAEFLQTQLDDLEESRRELRRVIGALDEEIGKRFLEAFEDIARYYEENFSLLFPGGKGALLITDADDVLSSGVELTAQPMGKKVGRLALLSGGERSLAALAFLFAVFRARPSPFYVLDEVEAALDDANLRRFLRLVDTLRSAAQLVVITHQQQTMEAADMLYGVTMEPGESSRVLSRRMEPARATAEEIPR